jgi:hypothetical protein
VVLEYDHEGVVEVRHAICFARVPTALAHDCCDWDRVCRATGALRE